MRIAGDSLEGVAVAQPIRERVMVGRRPKRSELAPTGILIPMAESTTPSEADLA